MTHFNSVMKEKEVLNLDLDDICDLLQAASYVTSEEMACKCALRWLEHESEKYTKESQHLQRILTSVRLEELNPAFIRTRLMTHPLVKKSFNCSRILQGVMDHLTMNTPCPIEVPLLPLRGSSNTGIILIGTKDIHNVPKECNFFTFAPDVKKTVYQGVLQCKRLNPLPAHHFSSAACCQGNTVYIAGKEVQ